MLGPTIINWGRRQIYLTPSETRPSLERFREPGPWELEVEIPMDNINVQKMCENVSFLLLFVTPCFFFTEDIVKSPVFSRILLGLLEAEQA